VLLQDIHPDWLTTYFTCMPASLFCKAHQLQKFSFATLEFLSAKLLKIKVLRDVTSCPEPIRPLSIRYRSPGLQPRFFGCPDPNRTLHQLSYPVHHFPPIVRSTVIPIIFIRQRYKVRIPLCLILYICIHTHTHTHIRNKVMQSF
jgi:hypothetical protein